MKKTSTVIACQVCIVLFTLSVTAQVPNAGFETWSAGNPANWYTNNVPTVAVPITQTTPPHSGMYALRGEVITSPVGNMMPLLISMDMAGNGFAISQSYATFSFYCKYLITGTGMFNAVATIQDALGNPIAIGAVDLSGTQSSYTLVNVPITYFGSGPAECILTFTIDDSVQAAPNAGDYFIVDDVSLSGIAGIGNPANGPVAAGAYPNPSSDRVTVTLSFPVAGPADITVLDALGNTVRSESVFAHAGRPFEMSLGIAELPVGIYLVRIAAGDGKWTTRFVKL